MLLGMTGSPFSMVNRIILCICFVFLDHLADGTHIGWFHTYIISSFCGTGVGTQGLHLVPLHQPAPFWVKYFRERVLPFVCLGWLRTGILQISASWVDRITGVSHLCLAWFHTLVIVDDITTNLGIKISLTYRFHILYMCPVVRLLDHVLVVPKCFY
jgi:hypothetical protein